MSRRLLVSGAFLGLVAVVLGAFAAHGLKPLISPDAAGSFETGVRYQMYSGLFLLVLSSLDVFSQRVKSTCCYLTLFGVLLFSGSIYLLSTNSLTAFDFTVIALLTPLGGALLISAWIVLLISAVKLKKK